METVNVGQDEWYPVYTLEVGDLEGPLASYYAVFEMDSEELAAIKRVYDEFYALQRKLAALYELHKQ